MAIIYANNNEVKVLDERVSALPDPVPPTPAADYYRHKVTISGDELNGHFYYTSTSNTTVSSATTVSDWYNNVYKSGTSFPGMYEDDEQKFEVLQVFCAVNPETGESTGALAKPFWGESPFIMQGFTSVTTDEIIDL